jgi:hypothetical protein
MHYFAIIICFRYHLLYKIYWGRHFQIDMSSWWGRIIEILDKLVNSFRELVLSCLLSKTQYVSLETDNFDACSMYEPTKCTKYNSVKHKI